MPFGLHKGTPINKLSSNYLYWFLSRENTRNDFPEIYFACKQEINKRDAQNSHWKTKLKIYIPDDTHWDVDDYNGTDAYGNDIN
jgi:hypothetical protein